MAQIIAYDLDQEDTAKELEAQYFSDAAWLCRSSKGGVRFDEVLNWTTRKLRGVIGAFNDAIKSDNEAQSAAMKSGIEE